MQYIESKVKDKSNPIGILSIFVSFLESQHIDPQIFFKQFDIDLDHLKHNLTPISVHMLGRIIQATEDLTACDHVGILIGKNASLSNIGPLRFLVLNAATIRDSLKSLLHYCSIWYRGQKLTLTEDQGYACICILIEGKISGQAQYQTAYLVAMVTIIELLFAKPWRPALVRISYDRPKSAHLYEKFFRCPVLFGQAQHEILFPQQQLDWERTGHDHQLDHFLREHLSELHRDHAVDMIAQVSQIIEQLLPFGLCNIEKVAEYFSVHRFTLYRYLNKHQTTFERLLESVRKKIAIRLLLNHHLSIIEVANELGYEDQGNFSRAFKRWYGIPPGRWRRERAQAVNIHVSETH